MKQSRIGKMFLLDYLPLGNNLGFVDIYTDNETSIIEKIAMTTESSVYHTSNLGEGGPLQDHSTNKIFLRCIVRECAIDENRGIHVGQGIHIDCVKVIYAIGCAGITRNTVVRDVGLGEEISNISSRINHRRPYDSDIVRNIRTTYTTVSIYIEVREQIAPYLCLTEGMVYGLVFAGVWLQSQHSVFLSNFGSMP